MAGYLDDPEATAEALDPDGWLRTGDLGVLDDRGCLRIVGRAKDMFIVGGFNAYPAEIENILLRHPDVQQAAVIGVPDERLGEVGMAFVVPGRATTGADDRPLVPRPDGQLQGPRVVEIVDELPLNATGKVMKDPPPRGRAPRGAARTDFGGPSTSSVATSSSPTRIRTSTTCAGSARCGRDHHGVVMVTGYEEAVGLHRSGDVLVVQLGDGTVPRPSRPARGRRRERAHRAAPRRAAVQRPDPDVRSAQAQGPPGPADAAAHAEAPQGERGLHVAPRRRPDRRVPRRGGCELVGDFAGPFTLYVIADLLGVPEADHETFREQLQGGHDRPNVVGSAKRRSMAATRWSSSTTGSRPTSRTAGGEPRDDVLTSLATATFPDGSTPEVIDVVRIAANLFSAGQETTVRLLAAAFQLLAERPDLQQLGSGTTPTASPTSSRSACGSRARSRATSGWLAAGPRWAAWTSRPGRP